MRGAHYLVKNDKSTVCIHEFPKGGVKLFNIGGQKALHRTCTFVYHYAHSFLTSINRVAV